MKSMLTAILLVLAFAQSVLAQDGALKTRDGVITVSGGFDVASTNASNLQNISFKTSDGRSFSELASLRLTSDYFQWDFKDNNGRYLSIKIPYVPPYSTPDEFLQYIKSKIPPPIKTSAIAYYGEYGGDTIGTSDWFGVVFSLLPFTPQKPLDLHLAAIPEPSSLSMITVGALLLAAFAGRRRWGFRSLFIPRFLGLAPTSGRSLTRPASP